MLGVSLGFSGIGGIVAGFLADRIGKRSILATTIMLYSVGTWWFWGWVVGEWIQQGVVPCEWYDVVVFLCLRVSPALCVRDPFFLPIQYIPPTQTHPIKNQQQAASSRAWLSFVHPTHSLLPTPIHP